MRIIFVLLLAFSFCINAQESSKLSVAMKNIGLSYKNVMNAQSNEDLLESLSSLSSLVREVKHEQFKPNLHEQSMEGLDKVLKVISTARKHAELGELDKAKKVLKQIDEYRKEYHKLHEPPSIWQLIFG